MPKCSCAGNACSCLVQGGSGITVTGQGTNAAPYVVSISPTPDQIDFTDEGTLDLGQLGASASARVVLHADATDVNLPEEGIRLDLIFEQDDTGGWEVTWPPTVAWPGGTAPTLTATAEAQDWITLLQAGSQWYGIRAGADLS